MGRSWRGWKVGPDERLEWLVPGVIALGGGLFAAGAALHVRTGYDTLGIVLMVTGLLILAVFGLSDFIP